MQVEERFNRYFSPKSRENGKLLDTDLRGPSDWSLLWRNSSLCPDLDNIFKNNKLKTQGKWYFNCYFKCEFYTLGLVAHKLILIEYILMEFLTPVSDNKNINLQNSNQILIPFTINIQSFLHPSLSGSIVFSGHNKLIVFRREKRFEWKRSRDFNEIEINQKFNYRY